MRPSRTCRFGVVLLSCVWPSAFAATIVVDPSGGGAFTAIQPALDAALDGDTVLVEPGEYVISEPIDFNRLHDPGDPGSPPVKDLILRSEDGAAVTTIRMAEEPSDPARASVVVFENGETAASMLEGFTVTGGRGVLSGPVVIGDDWLYDWYQRRGGGTLCVGTSPTLRHCVISGNAVSSDSDDWEPSDEGVYYTYSGGGVCIDGGSPTLTACTISANWAEDDGGAVHCEDSCPVLTDCTIFGNSAMCNGAGVRCQHGASPTLTNCTISGNASISGGGLSAEDGSSPILTGCTISGNSATSHGGGVHCVRNSSPVLADCTISGNLGNDSGGLSCTEGSSPTVTDCTISGNTGISGAGGGGVGCSTDSSPTFTNCEISGNATGSSGGGVSCSSSSPILTNCTIWGNSARYFGGGLYFEFSSAPTLASCTISGNLARWEGGGVSSQWSSPTLTNCIVWDNAAGSLRAMGDPLPIVTFSCVETQMLWPGEGNILADPHFCGWGAREEVWVDPSQPGPGDGSQASPLSDPRQATNNYSLALATGSPCLGTGQGGVDMGADTGTCSGPAGTTRIVQLAAGSYRTEEFDLSHKVSLVGSGAAATVLEGTVFGLRTCCSLSDLTITGGMDGGVEVSTGERPRIETCTIAGNFGPGVRCFASHPEIAGCTISGNSASDGGGVCCYNSSPELTECAISGNLSTQGNGGGGVRCYDSSPTLTNCTISGNRAISGGGGVYCEFNSFPSFTNCTISNNSTKWYGAGGVHCQDESSPLLTNSIIWGNEPESACGLLSHCLTDRDPLFVAPGVFDFSRFQTIEIDGEAYDLPDFIVESPDYHLQAGSPCVDAADPASAPAFDLEGSSRPCGAGPDIGAYERGGCRDTLVLDDGDPGTFAVGRWLPSGGTPAWGEGCVYGYEDGSSYTFDFAVPGSGTWAVELWWTTWPSRLREVPVEIEHAGGISTVLVDQQEDGGAWNRLGTYTFEGRAVVRILAAAGGSTCADAVKLVGVAEPPPPPPPPAADGGGSSGCSASANAPGPESAAPYAFLVAMILLLRAGALRRSRGRS